MSVSDLNYPGNAAARPVALGAPAPGVEVWWCRLVAEDTAIADLTGWLSAAEHQRAARFGSAALARRYVIGRAALRWVLARHGGLQPQQVPIVRGVRGRPQWDGGGPDFNVSNTRDVAVIAVSANASRRVGIDIEHQDRAVNHAGLARKFLTASEQAGLASLPPDAARQRFLRLWTCKEAMSKATGDALSAPMRKLEVEVAPALRLVAGPTPYDPPRWTLADAPVPDGFIATLAQWNPASG